MRRIIFMGQAGDQTVYVNTKTNEALISDKSVFLNTQGARKSQGCLIPILTLAALLAVGEV